MNNDKQSLMMAFALVAMLGGGLFVDYQLLTGQGETDSYFYSLAGRFLAKFHLMVRIGFVLCLMALAAFMPRKRTAKKRFELPAAAKVASVLGFLLGAAALTKAEFLPLLEYSYPAAVALVTGCGLLVGSFLNPAPKSGIQNEKRKIENEYSFNLKTKHGWINILNAFRGILIIGGAGSGKTFFIARQIIKQAILKFFCGFVYDFKFDPHDKESLTREVYKHYYQAKKRGKKLPKLFIVNFSKEHVEYSHRVNPVAPENMPEREYAVEYAKAIINNMNPKSIEHMDFWDRSAGVLLAAVFWYLKKHHPEHCTIPTAISLICQKDYLKLIKLLEKDTETASMISALSVAAASNADNQLSGQMGTIQITLSDLDTPNKSWVLSGNDFSLRLNDKNDPKFLCLGNNATLTQSTSPLLACIATVIFKLCNRSGGHHFLGLLDEAPTLFIPNLDQVPATGRSNKMAIVYMAQDPSQMVKSYGKSQSDAIISNLNNQFWGRVSNPQTAGYVSSIFGKEWVKVESQSTSRTAGFEGKATVSTSAREEQRNLIEPNQVIDLMVGGFVGTTVDVQEKGGKPNFHSTIIPPKPDKEVVPPMPAFSKNVDIEGNYRRIKEQAESILNTVVMPPQPQKETKTKKQTKEVE